MKNKLMDIIGQKMVPVIPVFLRTLSSFSENFFGILRTIFVNAENTMFTKNLKEGGGDNDIFQKKKQT